MMNKVLVIDDQADNLMAIKAVINSYLPDFLVITAICGADGIKIARAEQPDSILLDIIMPGMDGFEVCQKLKADESTRHIPVGMVTAIKTDSASRVRALEIGADVFISKPVDPSELIALLKVMLRIKHSEDQLRDEKNNIEQIVQSRTEELQFSNRKLKQEIEEREKAQQRLSLSQLRQASILKTALDGFWLSDMEGRLLEVNETYCQMSGYGAEELLGMSVFNLEIMETQLETEKHIRNTIEKGEDRFESQHRRKDGSIFDIEVSVQYQNVDGGRFVAFINDITQRKQAEAEMNNSHERASLQRHAIARLAVDESISMGELPDFFHRLTEEIAHAMMVDRAGVWMFSDDKTLLQSVSLYKTGNKEQISGTLLNYIDFPRYFDALHKENTVNASDARSDPRTSEFSEKYLIPLNITSMLDAAIHVEGEMIGVVCFEHTGEKRIWRPDEESFAISVASIVAQAIANEKRKQTEKMLHDIIEKNPISIQIIDKYGYTLNVNPAHTALFSAVPPSGFSIFDDLQSKIPGFDKLISLARQGEVVHLPDTFYNVHDISPEFPDNPVWIQATLFPLADNSGLPEKFVLMHENITERKKSEKEILSLNQDLDLRVQQRTSELEEANLELETFSYSVSHDLIAPLRRIKGFISLCLDGKSSQFSPEEQEYLKHISESSIEMAKLIEAMLSFSRLKKTGLQKTIIHSYSMVQQVIQFFESDLINRHVTFNIETLPDVKGDEGLIRQVWMNLISNAIKYTGKKQEAVIEIGAISTAIETTFFIKDNGAGFNMKYADKLFGVFQRLHKTRDFDGVGIGLANVNRIIMRHGGRCSAEGETDRGATFYFSLPN